MNATQGKPSPDAEADRIRGRLTRGVFISFGDVLRYRGAMQSTCPEQVAEELHAIVGAAVSDQEFSSLVDRVVAHRLLGSAGLPEGFE